MPDKLCLGRGRLPGKPVPVNPKIPFMVDREVADLEAGEVVEEVGSQGGFDLEVIKIGFDDRPNRRDLRPGDRDPKPGVTRSPAAGADQNTLPAGVPELVVDQSDVHGNLASVGRVERVRLDVHDVVDIADAPVTQHLGTRA